ncbi:beta-ketoacyl-[acyl-carrier-protein] synthase family protein [Streptomyces sp. MW-W600-10]|uniref:beta-ketoacyl-[acyl-carrier-protein] synthase family protein n=1 Tax=Streptomyces sp. MW-W600-10 TaxID=2829819 RepID=UPI0027E4EC04|nr:beta-ketoacyl-[acyl-carrier-protein] synthase family protein [Streptomyces sp. MW-W600-10]
MTARPVPGDRAPVWITGAGVVSPAGLGVEATWERVCAGRPTARTDPDLAGLPVDFSCRVPPYDLREALPGVPLPAAERLDPFTVFAATAAGEAIADAGLDPGAWPAERVAVVVGTSLGGARTLEEQHERFLHGGVQRLSASLLPRYMPNLVAGQLSIVFGARGPCLQTSTACASGATAITIAADLLRAGRCDIALAGATEACVTPLITSAFARLGALSQRTDAPGEASRPFDRERDGFVMGEGAGMVVLERAEDATARGHRGRALLAGYGATSDAHHPVAPDPQGAGAVRAIQAALEDAAADADEVDHVNAHGTSTPLNDAMESAVISHVLGPRPVVTSTKGVTGHLLGAAGAVEAVLTVRTLEEALVPPCANLHEMSEGIDIDVVTGRPRHHPVRLALSNSFGFGGHNVVLAFRRL